jgi:hypothetical protein
MRFGVRRGSLALGAALLLVVAPGAVAQAPEESRVADMPSLSGTTGILRVVAADPGPAGSFRVQLLTEISRAREFLAFNPPDTNTHFGARLALAYSPLDWLEAFAVVQGSSNDNNRGTPNPMQTLGDVTLGLKACARLGRSACVGFEGAAVILSGAGEVPFTVRSTSFFLRFLVTALAGDVARIHFNAGTLIDNSDALLRPGFSPIQRYAYRVNESSRIFTGLGVELTPSPIVAPFAEWSLEIPVSLPETPGAPGFSSYPHIFSAGARLFPWKGLAVLFGVDFGITSSSRVGLPTIPPWQLYCGLGWAFGPRRKARAENVRERDDF